MWLHTTYREGDLLMNLNYKRLLVPSVAAVLIASAVGACSQSPTQQSGSQPSSPKQAGCGVATAAEIAEASGMPIRQSTDNSVVGWTEPGCYYTDTAFRDNPHAAVVVKLYGDTWDAFAAKIEADPQDIVQNVPGLGQQAKYVTVTHQPDGLLLVKANPTQGFSIKLSSDTDNPQQREVAVAKLILPRI